MPRDADLLLAEATYAAAGPGARRRPHDGGGDRRDGARRPPSRRLVLTHLAAEDRDGSLAAARAFHGATELALPGAVFDF